MWIKSKDLQRSPQARTQDSSKKANVFSTRRGAKKSVNAWWVGRDPTKRALMLQFNNREAKMAFMKTRVALKALAGDPIYLDDDLTILQVKHRQACMPKIRELRKDGKKVFYRNGRIFVDGKPLA